MKNFSQFLLLFSSLSAQDSLLEVFKNTSVEGFTYGQYTAMFGKDASGSAFQTRLWVDLESGAYHGFSVGTRVFVDYGTSGPDGGTFLQNSGSPTGLPQISLMSLYGTWTPSSSKTTLTAGKMNIIAPFSDYQWDFGYGVGVSNNDIDKITFNLQAYGAWGLDDWNNIQSTPFGDGGENTNSDRPLFIAGIQGEDLGGFGFDLWAAHAIKTIDFLIFTGLNYSISNLTLQAQLATTQVNTQSIYFKQSPLAAKLRGLYNIQVGYENSGFGVTVGYTGSFGDGYGALFNYCGGFNMGGNIWWDVGSGNGYALNGVGGYTQGRQKTDIAVAYATLSYTHTKAFVNLSYAYVGGNNQYRLMQKGFDRLKNSSSLLGGSLNATLHEVSATFGYNFSDKLSLSALVGSTLGDLNIGKAQIKLNYNF